MPQLNPSPSLNTISLGNGACTKCDLCKNRTLVINGYGNTQTKILFVTDTVSGYEESAQKPLQGVNGKLFDRMLVQAGLSRASIFITPVIRCKGAPKTPKQLQISIDACREYLDKEIEAIKPNVIVPMGSTALKTVMGNRTLNITRERGILHFSDKYQCKVVPIFHPNYLMQVPHYEQVTIQDLCRIKLESQSLGALPTPKRNHKVILTVEDFKSFLATHRLADTLACDIESTGLDWLVDKVIGISFSRAAGEAYYIPFIKGSGDLSPLWGEHQNFIVDGVKLLLSGPSKKIFHNGAFDVKLLKQDLGVDVVNFCWDTLLMDHLLDENARGLHGLENCALRFTDFGSYKQPVVRWFKDQKIAEKNRNYAMLPLELIGPYGAADSDVTFTLYELFVPKMKEQGLMRLFTQIVMPIQKRLIETEFRGIEIDVDYLSKLEVQFKEEIINLEQSIYKLVGTFKINSSQELEEILFTTLKLKPLKKTKTGRWSTDKEVLKELSGQHPIIEPLQRYKLVTKLLRTYVIGLRLKLDKLGRLHTSYLVTGTTTGRLSSRKPNLQNIPASTNDIQNAFIAGRGRLFIAADYSQAEFRAWANFSRDPQMIADCNQGEGFDIHKEVASVIFKVPTTKITKIQRNLAKTCLFGGIYGRGPNSIAEQFKVPMAEAHRIVEYIKRRYPLGFKWIVRQQHEAQRTGVVRTLFGRTRHLAPALESLNDEIRAKALRLAVNSPVQGTIGDLNSIATLRVLDRFEKEGIDGYLALTIHDALTFNVAEAQKDQATRIIREEMERPVQGFDVPVFVDMKIGERWGVVRKIEDEEFLEDPKEINEEVEDEDGDEE